MELYLIRHGEPEYSLNQEGKKVIYGPDVPLSDAGRIGIEKLAQKLEDSSIDILFSSPYPRARQTADIIGSILKIPVVEKENLKDLWVPGWVGVTFEEFIGLGSNVYKQPPRSPDQETWEHLVARTIDTYEEIHRKSELMTPGIVSHGDILGILLYYVRFGKKPRRYDDIVEEYVARGEACKVAANSGGFFEFISGEGQPKSGWRIT